MDCLTTLPPEVLQRLLSKLDQSTLIGTVPSVCKSLRNQALAVAASVSVELGNKTAADKFAAWVAKYGHTALGSLEVLAPRNVHVQLPFSAAVQQLQQLVLAGGRCSQQAICFGALLQLTSLEITGITADRSLLHEIALLENLQSLALHNIDSGPLIGEQDVCCQLTSCTASKSMPPDMQHPRHSFNNNHHKSSLSPNRLCVFMLLVHSSAGVIPAVKQGREASCHHQTSGLLTTMFYAPLMPQQVRATHTLPPCCAAAGLQMLPADNALKQVLS
jgi:hypothetical protein